MIVRFAPAAAAAGYLALALVATWPLATRLATHVPGSNVDEGAFLWNLWWVRFALLDLRQSPFWTDYIFYPVGVNLATYTLTFLNGLLAIPLERAAGPIVAGNVLFLLSLTLSGLGAYLLVREVLTEGGRSSAATEGASIAAGIVFAFPASRFVYAALGQMNFASTAPLPFFLLFFLRLLRGARQGRLPLGTAVLAGLSFAAAALTELTYAVFLALFVLPFLVGEARWWWAKRALPLALGSGLAFCAAAAALPLLIVVPRYLADSAVAPPSLSEAQRFSADLLSFVVPTRLHPWLGRLAREWSEDFRDIPIAFLGWTTLLLGIIGAAARWRQARVWAAAAALFALLALGPLLTINGQTRFDLDGLIVSVPLPFLALHYVPLVGANRVPNRFSVVLMLALAVLVGFALHWLARRLPPAAFAALALAAAALIFLEHLSAPLPLRAATPPAGYERIRDEPGDFAILQLPLGWRNSYGTQGLERTIVQSYQWAHQKRLFGGNTSRTPESTFAYFRRVPLFESIIRLEEGKPLAPEAASRDRAGAAYLTALYDLRYLAVYRPLTPPGVEEYVRSALGAELLAEGELTIYRIPPAPLPRRVDLGTPLSAGAVGEGWGEDERGAGEIDLVWATARRAELWIPCPPGAATIRLRLTPFVYPGMPEQRLRLRLNGRDLGEQALAPDWAEIEFDAPAEAWRRGANRLTFEFAAVESPARVLGTPDRRSLAAALDWVEIVPR
ncbi:MAG: hypothetical protein RMM58_00970 [Chloroflexota bacterium]|nr:hypothetical protein [Dehalococcoidia bacterium]MDW8252430.1 hypothetical protein [Chloroflexota bacterium]